MKLYVRVFEKRGSLKRVFNRTYELREYRDYLAMMSELRRALWEVYARKLGASRRLRY